jgi:hypothetical protein
MRDDFPQFVKERLAKRVAYLCSNPKCRKPTSGPQTGPIEVINIGVAAHITAASSNGPRYDATLSAEERSDAENGIWLCQNCGKLADNDEVRYTVEVLKDWKYRAETAAAVALEKPGSARNDLDVFTKVERQMPELLAEMRKDLSANPLCREFVVVRKVLMFSWSKPILIYYYEDHSSLDDKMHILQNHRLIQNISDDPDVPRYVISEPFADYLTSD